jgi:hypothetical protein
MAINFPSTGDPYHLADQARRLADDLDMILSGAPLDPSLLAGAPTLDAWRLTMRPAQALIGVVDGHPHIVSGHRALTSELFAVDASAGWARTWSRFYQLRRALGDGRLQ